MTIASSLTALNTDIQNARTAITNKGGTVTVNGGSSQLATDIGTITELKGETVTINPSTSSQTITPTSPKNGITSATVNPVTSAIDANIQAGNIKKNVQILGVTGTFEGGGIGIPRTVVGDTLSKTSTSWDLPSNVENIGEYSLYYAQYNNPHLASVSGFDNLDIIASYGMGYCFYGCSGLTGPFDMSGTTYVNMYGCTNCFRGASGITNFDFSNVEQAGSNAFYYAFCDTKQSATFDFSKLKTVGSNAFQYAFSFSSQPTGESTDFYFDEVTSVAASSFASAFARRNPSNIRFGKLETVSAGSCFNSFCSNGDQMRRFKVWSFFPKLKTINGTSCFASAFTYSRAKVIVFDSLEEIGTTGNTSSTFGSCCNYASFLRGQGDRNDNCGFACPVLKTIGNTSTTNYAHFANAFTNSNTSTRVSFPELETVNSYSTTAARGQFAASGAIKYFMPKLKYINGQPQNIFNGDTVLQEIHFGKENQATIQAINGYASKWGASNATIYFDLINHITVDGVVYDRQGKNYDYDKEYFSWNNGDTVIYTKNQFTPTVGDTVYTKSGDTYTALANTITAVS